MMFNGLVVESTTRCNAKCGMCYQGAGPKGSDYLGDAALGVDEIRRAMDQARPLPSLNKRFHLAGGEAFIAVDDCVELFSHASATGWTDVSCTTNAYWAADMMKARRLAARLRDAGLLRAEISWDYWHGPHIPPQAINNALQALAANDVDVTLRILTTRTHSFEEALAMLSPAALARVPVVSSAPVYQVGRGLGMSDDDIYPGDPDAACHSGLNLTINARGDVFPCCAGLDQTRALFGNIRERSLADIAEDINRSLLVRLVVFEGINALRPILRLLGESIRDEYSSICSMCFDVFSDTARVDRLMRFFADLEADALREALQAQAALPAALEGVPA